MSESSESYVVFRVRLHVIDEKFKAYFKLIPLGVVKRHLFGGIQAHRRWFDSST